ncbi:MAG: hypothetical protein CEN89_300 [Candidatus Berkelbacteria bacterium Licking1014_7]|uniref:Uncharacterized protein n=1 Tax=Candidatus Berkelbacteria bacterium Licking1014_7 TaxID=2017147 RepID=A0A554LJM6_9BACT|nr:MAG: hypothetical protein CEN89_300 [Candidatus Berkelbacteria bacterium Licking1014_7]
MKYLKAVLAIVAGALIFVWRDAGLTIVATFLILAGLLDLGKEE